WSCCDWPCDSGAYRESLGLLCHPPLPTWRSRLWQRRTRATEFKRELYSHRRRYWGPVASFHAGLGVYGRRSDPKSSLRISARNRRSVAQLFARLCGGICFLALDAAGRVVAGRRHVHLFFGYRRETVIRTETPPECGNTANPVFVGVG